MCLQLLFLWKISLDPNLYSRVRRQHTIYREFFYRTTNCKPSNALEVENRTLTLILLVVIRITIATSLNMIDTKPGILAS